MQGCITVPEAVSTDEVIDKFLAFVEKNKWSFDGGDRTIIDGYYMNADGTRGKHVLLILHTSPLSLTRHPNDGTFEIIWPEQVCFAINDRETLNFRDGDKLYFNVWYEDPDYREETLVRSVQDGTILENFPGDIRIMPNGERWLIK